MDILCLATGGTGGGAAPHCRLDSMAPVTELTPDRSAFLSAAREANPYKNNTILN